MTARSAGQGCDLAEIERLALRMWREREMRFPSRVRRMGGER